MATAGSNFDIVLAQSDGSTTQTGLMLASRDGEYLYTARRLPTLPEQDIFVEQKSWHLGFGDYLSRPNDPFRYAFSNGVDLRHANGAQLGPQVSTMLGFLTPPGDAENGVTTGWTAGTGVTLTVDAAAKKNGSYGFKIVTDGSRSADDVLISFTIINPTVFRSRGLDWGAYVKRLSGSDSGIEPFITDSAATTAENATTSSTFTFVGTHRTINSGATSIVVGFRMADNESAEHIFYIDDMSVMELGHGAIRAVQEYAGAFYLACGRVIAVLDETNDRFDAVLYDDGHDIENFAVHGGRIYASAGGTYWYSNDTSGARTDWTEVTPDTGQAEKFLQAPNQDGDLKLFRLDIPNEIYVSTETYNAAVGAGDWASALVAGETDKEVTHMFQAFDTSWVSREDGLFYYYPPEDRWRSATEQFKFLPSGESFGTPMEYIDGWVYATAARRGLLRFKLQGGDIIFDQQAPRYQAEMFDDFGGRVRSLIHDGLWLYALQDRPLADLTETKTVNLLCARNEQTQNGVELVWHTLFTPDIGQIAIMGIDVNTATTPATPYLYLFGRRATGTDTTSAGGATQWYLTANFRMNLPAQHDNMMKEATPALLKSGTVVTSIMDYAEYGYANDDKAFTKIVVYGDNINSNRTITVEEQIDAGIDDGGAWTAVGSAITSLSNGSATLTFSAGSASTGKRVRLRFTLTSNVTTDGPILRGFRLYCVPHPDRFWTWELTAKLGNTRGVSGQLTNDTPANTMANLTTLDSQDYPLKFNDIDGTQYNVQIVSLNRQAVLRGSGMSQRDPERLEQRVTLSLREVLTS